MGNLYSKVYLRCLPLNGNRYGKALLLLIFLGFFTFGGNAQCADTSPTGDCDGDSVLNGVDQDDDNDGILDVDEYDCAVGGSDLVWGVPVWSGVPGLPGAGPDDNSETTVTTTIDGTVIMADNTLTDITTSIPSYDALEGTTFNGKNGLLLQAQRNELASGTISYRLRFDRPVTGLSFSVVDIDRDDANPGEFTDRVRVIASNGGISLPLVAGSDYTVPNPTVVNDVGGGVFEGLRLIGNTNTTDADVIFTIAEPVDELLVEFSNAETSTSTGFTAFLISDLSWACAFRDFDVDGIADHLDTDSDGDGCADALEGNGVFTIADLDVDDSLSDVVNPANGIPTVAGAGQADVSSIDASVTGGGCDDDGDGLTNDNETTLGIDPNNVDTDGDGVNDGDEVASTNNPLDSCDPVQAAGYTGFDGANAIWTAADCDGDSVANGDEVTNGTDSYENTDTDGDGIPDDRETADGSNLNDPCDPVQTVGYIGFDGANAIWTAADCDGDGVINGDEFTNGTDSYAVSADSDGDGIDNDNEINYGTDENGPCNPLRTAGYTGFDGTNAIWAATDCDGDGITNGDEFTNGTDPYNGDSDGDGLEDGTEVTNGNDPLDPCDPVQALGYTGFDGANAIWTAADCDGDGVTNGDEVTNGTDSYTINGDTDGDGMENNAEITNGTNPNDPCDPVQTAGYTGFDGMNAIWASADCDGDQLDNGEEIILGTDPYNPDSDGDGISDGREVLDNTNPLDECDSVCGNPSAQSDCDFDGLTFEQENNLGTDSNDSDTDDDGIHDGQEKDDNTDSLDPCDSMGGTPPSDAVCDIAIGNSILSANGDGVNDFFDITNIESFPNNTVQIYNRWGVIVFEAGGYDNNAVVFRGNSEGRATLSEGEQLPAGVYFYTIQFDNGNRSTSKSGYLYINR